MPSTMWTTILRAQEQGGELLDGILAKYRPPVVAYLRARGFQAEDAEDLAQAVFLEFVKKDLLAKADRERGKFRNLLFTVVRHTVAGRRREQSRLKRGGDVQHVPMDGVAMPEPENDDEFDHLWIHHLLGIGMSRLKLESEKSGGLQFESLFLFAEGGLGYPEIAKKLDLPLSQVKNNIHYARRKLKTYVMEEVQAYSSSDNEYQSEVAYLMTFLK